MILHVLWVILPQKLWSYLGHGIKLLLSTLLSVSLQLVCSVCNNPANMDHIYL